MIERKNSKFYETNPVAMAFTSNSLFTHRFKEGLKEILGPNNSNFIGKTSKQKKKIETQIESLLEIESTWHVLIKSSKFDKTKIKTLFPEELTQFENAFSKNFFPSEGAKTKREVSIFGSSYVNIFLNGLMFFIKRKTNFVLNDLGMQYVLNEDDLSSMVLEINSSFLFNEIVKLCLKHAYDSSINIKGVNSIDFYNKKLDTDFLSVKRTDIFYSLTSYLNIYLANLLLNFLAKKNLLQKNDLEFVINSLKILDSVFKQKKKENFSIEEQKIAGGK